MTLPGAAGTGTMPAMPATRGDGDVTSHFFENAFLFAAAFTCSVFYFYQVLLPILLLFLTSLCLRSLLCEHLRFGRPALFVALPHQTCHIALMMRP